MKLLLLGPSELRSDEGDCVPLGGARRRAVLAALALNLNRVVPVERLLDLVWDERPPPSAKAALQGHVASLRTRLDSTLHLVTRAPGYALMADRNLVDAHHMEDLVAAAQEASDDEAVRLLDSALDLWRGPALEDCESRSLRSCAEARLEHTRLRALELLGERLLRTGRAGLAVPRLAAAVEENPLRESLVRLLMLCHQQEGRQAEALRMYHATREQLKLDLGVAPSPQLQEAFADLLGRMRSGPQVPAARRAPRTVIASPQALRPPTAPAPPPAPSGQRIRPAQLPRTPGGFIGRTDEFRSVDRALAPDSSGVALVVGQAGVGKTSLALRWAHSHAGDYPDGQLFADLHGFDGSTPVEPSVVISGFLSALGVPQDLIPDDPAAAQALYRSMLAQRRLLILLDDARESAQVRPLLTGGGGSATIVTSRLRLDGLLALDGAALVPVGVLDEEEGLALLRVALRDDRIEREPEAARELVRLCSGLPLALRITAARLAAHPWWSLASVADELGDEQQRLAALAIEDADITAALTLSVRALSGEAQAVFSALSVVPGGDFTAHAIAAACRMPLAASRRALAALAGAHLIEQRSLGRYSCHDLVQLFSRQYGAEGRGDRLRGLLDFYVHTAYAASRVYDPEGRPCCDLPGWCERPQDIPVLTDRRAVLDWYETESANLCAAIEAAARAGEAGRAWRLTVLVWPLMTWQSHRDWTPVVAHALRAARATGDPCAETRVANLLGWATVEAGRAEDAIPLLERSRELAVRTGDDCDLAQALINLGLAHAACGSYEAAVAVYEEAARVAEEIRDYGTAAIALHHVARLYLDRGRADRALIHAERARLMPGARGLVGVLLCDVQGVALCRTGDPWAALQQLEEGLAEARAEKFITGEVKVLEHLVEVTERLGLRAENEDYRSAATHLRGRMQEGARAPL
ncbi:BTAD domain-containing putative transcriptional regulator [Streptomyces sp. NPDC058579]|uniref:AfsR/SARP family transcriptional regulator n=1 Tax=Streptomyces sp. NPDC058579 TaxID=3346548 RepID=UPI00364824CA